VTDNVLRRLFLDTDWRRRFIPWESVAASAVAQFRAFTGRYVGHPELDAFVLALSKESAEFATLWGEHRLAPSPSWEKAISHPERGRLRLFYTTMQPENEPADIRIVIYVPAA
jgi:hypothetical protein